MRRILYVSLMTLALFLSPLTAIANVFSVEVTNITTASFTVSWISDVEEPGTVNWGPSPGNLNAVAYDVRSSTSGDYSIPGFGQNTAAQTHYVTVIIFLKYNLDTIIIR